MLHLNSVSAIILEGISGYDFTSFSIGVTLKPSFLDRDDYVRSKIRAKGSDSIKTALTKSLTRIISKECDSILDHTNPDITILLDMRHNSCSVRSRSLVVQAHYTKYRRGIPQKKLCNSCDGSGCDSCPRNSVESMFTSFLLDVVGGTGVRFTWVGGEDSSSLVHGRCMYARIQNPVRRDIILPSDLTYPGVKFHDISTISRLPPQIPKFVSTTRIRVETDTAILPKKLRSLKSLRGIISIGDDTFKPACRTIHSLNYRRVSDNVFRLFIQAEGGMPIKRFVSGHGVEPSVSGVLGIACVCSRFDFLAIQNQPDN